MPDIRDILNQFEELPPSEQLDLVLRFSKTHGFLYHPEFFIKYFEFGFPSVIRTPGVCGGSARLVRTRIPVWVLQRMRQLGCSEAKILESYPALTAADLVQAWGYAAANRAEVEREIEENERD